MWTIFQVVTLFAAGSLIIFGGEVAGQAISVSAFLGVATVVAWLVLSWIFSKLIELAQPTYRRGRVFSFFLFTRVRQYFRGFVKAQITTLSERIKELHEAAAASGKKIEGAVRARRQWPAE
jgi:hypothetical protein